MAEHGDVCKGVMGRLRSQDIENGSVDIAWFCHEKSCGRSATRDFSVSKMVLSVY